MVSTKNPFSRTVLLGLASLGLASLGSDRLGQVWHLNLGNLVTVNVAHTEGPK